MTRPFWIALQFLTALPVGFHRPPEAPEIGYSLLYYPLVGLVIGTLLSLPAILLADTSSPVAAGLVVAIWVLLTGALHLDGLADSADAWLGGLGDRQRTLDIMKDPCSGPAGVTALVLLLMLKLVALMQLLPNGHWSVLVVMPVLGRTALVALFLSTPYVRQNGLGRLLADYFPRRAAIRLVTATCVLIWLVFGSSGIILLLITAVLVLLLGRMMQRRLGGFTGDTAGALVEITEVAGLLAMTFWD